MEQIVTEGQADDGMFLDYEEDANALSKKYLLFNIADEIYGISIASVVEIVEVLNITSVPDMPNFIKGVINLRGRVVPVMDLRLRFNIEEREHDDRTCIIIVNVGASSMGFIVDTVAEVQDIPEQDIDPPPSFETNTGREHYVSGLGKMEDYVAILVDVDRIVHETQIKSIEQAL